VQLVAGLDESDVTGHVEDLSLYAYDNSFLAVYFHEDTGPMSLLGSVSEPSCTVVPTGTEVSALPFPLMKVAQAAAGTSAGADAVADVGPKVSLIDEST
jgi:hypothetical protein